MGKVDSPWSIVDMIPLTIDYGPSTMDYGFF